ncbi:MAG TPA: DUF2071 domain-containing protein [Thermoleophilaceae bacterium]
MARSPVQLAAGAAEATMAPLRSVSRSFAQPRTLREVAHRPWPVPERPWVMAQSWVDLLFAHWRVPPESLQEVVPDRLPVDTFDGSAWIGVTPFEVGAFRLRGVPHVPGVTSFLETNVRTYVTVGGKPGIHFLSLDAASRLAVAGARRAYRLPYFHAKMGARRAGGWIDYSCERTSADGPPAELRLRYRPTGDPFQAPPGSLDHFLAERYCLYTLDGERRVLRAEIHHPPWPLQPADAELSRNTMAAAFGQSLSGAPVLHFAARQDVIVWGLEEA